MGPRSVESLDSAVAAEGKNVSRGVAERDELGENQRQLSNFWDGGISYEIFLNSSYSATLGEPSLSK